MADTKISALTAATDLVASEMAGIQGGANKRFGVALWDAIYQALLVSGTNIKTINGSSVLGAGNLTVGGATTGTATVDFGAFPGTSDTSVAVTGQTNIVSGSIVQAWLRPVATADHSADEHLVETIKVLAGNISAGVGFTIYALNTNTLNEPVTEPRMNRFAGVGQDAGPGQAFGTTNYGGKGTRIYGQWTIAWSWI